MTAPAVLDCADSVTGILDLMMIYRETNTLIATKATMLLTVLAQDNNLKLVGTPETNGAAYALTFDVIFNRLLLYLS